MNYLYLNPKHLLIEWMPFDLPWLITAIDLRPTFLPLTTRKKWTDRTPELLFVPALNPGVAAFVGYTFEKTRLARPPLDDHQAHALNCLYLHYRREEATGAISWHADGVARAKSGGKADPNWLPTPDAALLDPTLAGPKWDGYEKWAERVAARTVVPDVPEESARTPDADGKVRYRPDPMRGITHARVRHPAEADPSSRTTVVPDVPRSPPAKAKPARRKPLPRDSGPSLFGG